MNKNLAFHNKKLVKWLSSLLLVILLSIILNACLIDQPYPLPEKQQGNLLLWHSLQGDLSQLIATGFQEFKQLNPDVNLMSEYIPQDELPLRFIQESQSGLGASAIIIFSKHIPELAKRGHLQSIDEKVIDLSTYLPPTLNQVRYHGKIYGIPLGSQIRVLCYNQAKLQASQDPFLSQPPTRLEGLIERSLKGYSVGMVSSFEDTFWGMGIFGGSFWNAQGAIQPQLEEWGKWLDWLKNASIQPNFVLNRNRSLLHDAFAQGNLTYYVCNSGEIIDLKNILKDNLRVALLPQEAQGKAAPLLYTRAVAFNHSAGLNEYHLGLNLTKFVTNTEQQLQGIVNTQSFIPSNRNIILDEKLLPIQSVLLKQSRTAIAISLDDLERLSTVFEKAEFLYQQAISGEISSVEAGKKLTLLINQSVNQQ